MNKQPETTTFGRGIVVAAVLAISASVAFNAAALWWPTSAVLNVMITILAGIYLGYLMIASGLRTGRMLLPFLWLTGSIALLIAPGDSLSLLVAHIAYLWLVRTLCYHRTLLAATADLGIHLMALAAAITAALYSHSVLLSVWSFFLVQALFVVIPGSRAACVKQQPETPEARFARAYSQADVALKRLHTSP